MDKKDIISYLHQSIFESDMRDNVIDGYKHLESCVEFLIKELEKSDKNDNN